MILADNLSYSYKNGTCVLKGISFEIKKGEFVAIIGPNGSGKTTLLKHFNGLLKPTGGRMLVNGIDTRKAKTSRLARYVGFLFQNPDHQIFCSTAYDEIAFGLKNIKEDEKNIDMHIREAAEKVGIGSLLDSNPFSLSKGQRQRIALASVLALETEIIVLDEPTTGQDYTEGIEIMNIVSDLNKQGKTIIMVTHDMELAAEYARRTIILHNGRILEDGATEAVMSKHDVLARSALQPPQICQLSRKFHRYGLFNNVYTVKDMFEQILEYLKEDNDIRVG